MNYPVNCDTTEKKLVFVSRAQGLLRVLYKAMTVWRFDGITEAQYNSMDSILSNMASNIGVTLTSSSQITIISNYIRNNYSFSANLSDVDYKAFLAKHTQFWQRAATLERNLLNKYHQNEKFDIELTELDIIEEE